MRMLQLGCLSMLFVACSDGGGGGSVDTLPKRGERATDPTIVSASASCEGELMFKGLVVVIDATDPTAANLGTCAATADAIVAQGMFSMGGRCLAELSHDCAIGTDYVVDLTIANKTGGVTTASVKVRP